MTAMLPVEIVGIHVDAATGTSAVLLGDPESMTRVLPIMIGPAEAQAIVMALAGVEPPRPSTHDLATTLLGLAGSRVEEVVVTELLDGVFYAELFVETGSGMHSVSARPSDSIALAIRVGAPIFVRESVLEEAGVPVEHEPSGPLADDEIERIVDEFQEFLASAQPSDFEMGDPGAGETTDDAGNASDVEMGDPGAGETTDDAGNAVDVEMGDPGAGETTDDAGDAVDDD